MKVKNLLPLIRRTLLQKAPKRGNKCRTKGCVGSVVQRVASLFRGRYFYDIPHCNTCGRTYPLADKRIVPRIGEEEFAQKLRKPVTI